jgi:hypothetical protein
MSYALAFPGSSTLSSIFPSILEKLQVLILYHPSAINVFLPALG